MKQDTLDNLKKGALRDMARSTGLTGGAIKDIGNRTRCMERVN